MSIRTLLPSVLRRLPAGSVPYRVLDRVERTWLRRQLPLAAYQEAGYVPVRLGGDLVVSHPTPAPWPDEVHRGNLELVLGLCEQLGVEHFLVLFDPRGLSRVGVVATAREQLLATLRDRGQREPVYVKRVRPSGEVTIAPHLDVDALAQGAGLRVWRAVHDPVTGRSYRERQACIVEFWKELPDGRLQAPGPNPRAAEVTTKERSSRRDLEVPAATYPTIPPFDVPSPLEVRFPIDMVYLWVDGADPAWRRRHHDRLHALGRAPVEDATAEFRFREQDELRYSLRSVERFAPWVRHIYLLTDDQRPAWLVDHPRLTVVDHRDVFPPEALPTFNSHAISARVHHIEGLSEHFLLMNDDVLLGRPVQPEDFFHANGLTKFFLSSSPIPSGPIAAEDPPHMAARKRVRDLVEDSYGIRPFQTFQHTPVALSRSWLAHLEDQYAEPYQRTVMAPFRSPQDIVSSWLHHYAGFAEGRALPGEVVYDYFNLSQADAFRRLGTLLTRRSVDCFCLNDAETVDIDLELRTRMLAAFLELFLPEPSAFEADGAGGGDRARLMATFQSGLSRL